MSEAPAAPAPDVRPGKSARTRAALRDMALKHFVEHGFDRANVPAIAAECGVTERTFYRHFATKDELLDEAFRYAAEAELAVLRGLAAVDLPPRERLDAVIEEFRPRGDFGSWKLWIEGWAEALRSERFRATSRELDEAWIGVLEDTIAAGVASGDFTCASPHDSAWRLSCLIEGLTIQLVAHGGTIDRTEMGRLIDAAVSAEISSG